MRFGDNLRNLRINHKITQQRLADDLGLSQASITSYENGLRMPPVNVIEKIADYFEVSTLSLMPYDNNSREDNIALIAETVYKNQKLKQLFDTIKTFSDQDLDVVLSVATSIAKNK